MTITSRSQSEVPAFPAPLEPTEQVSDRYLQSQDTSGLLKVTLPADGLRAHVATRHQDAITVHTHSALSRSAAQSNPAITRICPPAGSLLALDGEQHRHLRTSANRALPDTLVHSYRAALVVTAEHLITSLDGRDTDLVGEYCRPLVVTGLAAVTGIPHTVVVSLETTSRDVLTQGPSPDVPQRMRDAATLIAQCVGGSVSAGAATPQREETGEQTMLSALAGQIRAGELDVATAVGLLVATVMAGTQTTIAAMATNIHRLASDQALRTALAKIDLTDTGHVPAIEEILRLTSVSTVSGFPRVVTQSTVIGGTELQPGDIVIASLDAANHDPQVFPAPDEWKLDRQPNRHLAFGHGPHYCLGATLARMMLAVGLGTFARRVQDAHLDETNTRWNTAGLVRGPGTLPACPHLHPRGGSQ